MFSTLAHGLPVRSKAGRTLTWFPAMLALLVAAAPVTAHGLPAPEKDPEDRAVYALTGTPLTNRPRDLFPLLQLCAHPLARSFLSFAKRYCAAYQNEYGWVTDGASNLEELAVQLHGIMLRRSKDDVLELPPKLRTWLPVEVAGDTGAK
jgi:hypothetical protein